MGILTADELLAGGSLSHSITLPDEFVKQNGKELPNRELVLKPLTIRDLQKIRKASSQDENLSAALMIKHALVEPELKLEQVSQLPAGLAQFLLERINEISGINTPRTELQEMVQAPLAKACFILAKEFGWTPEEVSGMTIGQILLYLEMAQGEKAKNE
ncbi:MAG: hypothetical protein Kow0042_26160 [Calditrichia bacterium]